LLERKKPRSRLLNNQKITFESLKISFYQESGTLADSKILQGARHIFICESVRHIDLTDWRVEILSAVQWFFVHVEQFAKNLSQNS
jgi:hypothetical protein